MKKLMLGSVAERVLQHAHCPVFVAIPIDYTDERCTESAEHGDHGGIQETACPRCHSARRRSHGEQLWCDKHARARQKPPTGPANSLELPNRMHYRP
jgi:hypothetical protein